METGAISTKIDRGKHTTRHSELICIDENTYIMDTPGFSSMYVNQFEKEELKDYFPEFKDYEDQCRFQGCVHIHEPGCAVKAALEAELSFQNGVNSALVATIPVSYTHLARAWPAHIPWRGPPL